MNTAYTHRTLVVVAAADREAANAAAAQIGRPADAGTFDVGLSPDGAAPPTHYVCSVALTEAERAQLEGLKTEFPTATVTDYDLDTEPNTAAAVFAALGLRPAPEEG